MGLPEKNATLTSVASGGTSEDYDQAAGTDTARWSGQADAYVVDKVRTMPGPNGLDRIKTTYLVVEADLGATVKTGDTVSWTQDGASRSGDVWEIVVAKIAGTCRLHLRDATTTGP